MANIASFSRNSLLAFLALVLLAAPAFALPPLPTPKIIAVYFYADWCVNCKKLSPAIDEARSNGGLDAKDVLFVKLDLTDPPRIHQAILQAQAMGIGDYIRMQGSATGYMALLDAKTKKEVMRFDRENSSAEIQAGIEKVLKQ